MEDKASSGNNTAVGTAESNSSPAKKTSKVKTVKSQRSKTLHPPTSEMVNAAIKELKDRKGSSLQAIKKYVATTYKVDGEKLAPFIKKYLKAAVTSGAIIQTKGKGASGSFKLSAGKGSESKSKVQKSVKATEPKKTKKSVEKKTTSVRKSTTSKKPRPVKKTGTTKKSAITKKTSVKIEKAEKIGKSKPVTETKTISKSKRTAKAPAAKTRTPKPKKAATSKTVKPAAKK